MQVPYDNKNKFFRVLLISRRAKQLINGDRKKVDIKAENPLTIAMEEVAQDKIDLDYVSRIPLLSKEPEPKAEEKPEISLADIFTREPDTEEEDTEKIEEEINEESEEEE